MALGRPAVRRAGGHWRPQRDTPRYDVPGSAGGVALPCSRLHDRVRRTANLISRLKMGRVESSRRRAKRATCSVPSRPHRPRSRRASSVSAFDSSQSTKRSRIRSGTRPDEPANAQAKDGSVHAPRRLPSISQPTKIGAVAAPSASAGASRAASRRTRSVGRGNRPTRLSRLHRKAAGSPRLASCRSGGFP